METEKKKPEDNNSLKTTLGTLELASPLLTASGTSGSGNELDVLEQSRDIIDSLGAFVTKGVTLNARPGNPEIRVIETRSGLLNSIGLQNKGVKHFMEENLPALLNYKLPVIVNISAESVEEFGKLAAAICEHDKDRKIAGLEINVSCPNVKQGGLAFGINPKAVERIVKSVKKNAPKGVLILTKLTPNITDITAPARAAIAGGSDALSMINTLKGVAINVKTRKPYFANVVAGLSGPAIKPVGVSMVYECFGKIPECRAKKVPIVGIGGISTWQDAVEYILAGASAVGVGTAWFVYPEVFPQIHKGLSNFLKDNDLTLSRLIGMAHS
jgi:dihydroorotate dehydrogenase (NAD+) catalytic subunit